LQINGVGHKPEASNVVSKDEGEKSEKPEKRIEPKQTPPQQRLATVSAPNSGKANGASSTANGTTAVSSSGTKLKRSAASTPAGDDGPKKKKQRVSKVEEEEEEDVLPLFLLSTLKFRDSKVVAAKFHPKHGHVIIGMIIFLVLLLTV